MSDEEIMKQLEEANELYNEELKKPAPKVMVDRILEKGNISLDLIPKLRERASAGLTVGEASEMKKALDLNVELPTDELRDRMERIVSMDYDGLKELNDQMSKQIKEMDKKVSVK